MPSNRLWKSTAFAVAAAGFTATLVPTPVQAQSYNIAQTIQGESFFDAFTYFGSFDNMTSGDVIFVDEQTGVSDRLTYINDAGNAIVKVDNTTFVPYNEKRNAVMLTSKNKYKTGTVWVFDALHVPSGCSVWGALWSRGAYANWPAGGEIDIFEGINQMQYNQMALHTTEGCTKPADVEQTGTTGLTDCNYEVNTNAGCTVQDRNPNSYGDAFAAVGGGVWITQFETTGINIWFFARPDIPTSVGGDSLDVSTLGTPTASYPASSCEIDRFFVEQEIIIDIKLCGTWAGVPSILEETCPPLESPLTCYTTYVIDNKSTYDKAYFELTSVKIYADSPDAVIVAEDSTSSTNSGTGSTPTGGGGGGSAGFRSVAAINPVVAGMVAMMVGAFSFGVMAVRF